MKTRTASTARLRMLGALVAALLASAPVAASADDFEQGSYRSDEYGSDAYAREDYGSDDYGREAQRSDGITVGSAAATLFYTPAKAAYAIAGTLVGGLAYAFSGGNSQTARSVIEPAAYGDWYVRPAHLRGEERLRWMGG